MEDAIAREGALARCNQDRDATLNDIECANARRAAAAMAVRDERERRAQLEAESQRKLLALRARVALEQQIAAQAVAAKQAAEKAAYEARWRDPTKQASQAGSADISGVPPQGGDASPVPAFGAPIGAPLSSIAGSHAPSEFDTQGSDAGAESVDAVAEPVATAASGPGETVLPVAGQSIEKGASTEPPSTGPDAPIAVTQPVANVAIAPAQPPDVVSPPVEEASLPVTSTEPEPPVDAAPPADAGAVAPAPSAIPRPFQSNDSNDN